MRGLFFAKTCPTCGTYFSLRSALIGASGPISGSVALRAKLTVGVGAASTADRARLRSRNQSETHIYSS